MDTPANQQSGQDRASGRDHALVCFKAAIRYSYMVALTAAILVLVIITLAAYRFQNDIAETQNDAHAGPAKSVPHLAEELLARYADLLLWEGYRDDRLDVYREAERAVPQVDRPALYESLNKARRQYPEWLPPLSLTKPAAPLAGAQAAPAPDLAAAGVGQAAVSPALEAYRDYLSYEVKLHMLRPKPDDAIYPHFHELAYFANLRPLTLGLIDPRTFAVMPPCLLTVVVTLAMGALGSLLNITKSYLADQRDSGLGPACDRHPLGWFLLQPLFGVVTAFAVFVFLQAGLALTDGALGEGDSTINPYFIAFVAIVAGLMSRQAIERIERWGKRFLSEERADRWAYGLDSALKELNGRRPDRAEHLDVAKLAEHLGTTEKQVQGWIEERRRVPPNMQERIAGLFGMDPRRLFSDEPSPLVG